jgi:hypothetical protein
MELKDISLIAGVVVTLLLGIGNLIYNVLLSRKTAFINTVTSERVKWIGNLRENLSRFVGLNHHWFVLHRDLDEEKKDEITQELRILRYKIRLQLNPSPSAHVDGQIMKLLDEIADRGSLGGFDMQRKLEDLTRHGQKLLKLEWDKVKSEAQRGALADQPKVKRRLAAVLLGHESPPRELNATISQTLSSD